MLWWPGKGEEQWLRLRDIPPVHFYIALQHFLPGFVCWSVSRRRRCFAAILKEKGYSEKPASHGPCTTDCTVGRVGVFGVVVVLGVWVLFVF